MRQGRRIGPEKRTYVLPPLSPYDSIRTGAKGRPRRKAAWPKTRLSNGLTRRGIRSQAAAWLRRAALTAMQCAWRHDSMRWASLSIRGSPGSPAEGRSGPAPFVATKLRCRSLTDGEIRVRFSSTACRTFFTSKSRSTSFIKSGQ